MDETTLSNVGVPGRPLRALTGAAADALNLFIGRNRHQNVQTIRLPHGDFMLRAGDDIFSSLTPAHSPQVVNLGEGRDFYDHSSFIISTVGLDPKTGERRQSLRNIGEAFSNHYSMVFTPEAQQDHYTRYLMNHQLQAVQENDPAGARKLLREPYEGHIWDYMTGLRPGHRVDEDLSPYGGRRMVPIRDAEQLPGFALRDARGGGANALMPPGTPEVLKRFLSGLESIHLQFPEGNTTIYDIMGENNSRMGILQAQMDDGSTMMNAYMNGKQIVSHPHMSIIPERTRYPFFYVVDSINDRSVKVPIDWRDEPTRILTHIYPDPNDPYSPDFREFLDEDELLENF